MPKISIVILTITFLFTNLLAEQIDNNKKTYTTKRVVSDNLNIDGHLNDFAWQSVDWSDGFVQREPYEGKDPSQQTKFKILYDDKNLYIAIYCYDTEPDKIVKRITRRDDFHGDRVGLQIDSYFDHRTAFSFTVNCAGVKGDEIITNDGDVWDSNWDAVWFTEVAMADSGWTVEIKIPFSQLRFGEKDEHTWGLQFHRYIYRKQEWSYWKFIPKGTQGWVRHFGELKGLKEIKTPKHIEFLPYTVASVETFKKEEGNPFATGRRTKINAGLDGKIGITSDLTMDLTINPDFGQVEADPSVLNLTAFETYYSEKRPFFIEGKNILDYKLLIGDSQYSNDVLFYSRRIGKPPSYEPDISSNEYIDVPQNTSIISALKLTGKTKNGLSIGVMEAVTSKEYAEIDSIGNRRKEIVEPLTNYFVGRTQKDFNGGNTILGGMFTATNRDISEEHLKFLNRSAYTGGVDFRHQWGKDGYRVEAKTAFSNINGDKSAILSAQESSRRYFQRPDANYVEVDTTLTSLSGYSGTVLFGKFGGQLQFLETVTARSPGFELNDIGYLYKADVIMHILWLGYNIWTPFSIFKTININTNNWANWTFGKENFAEGGNINLNANFINNWSCGVGVNRENEYLSVSGLRGGPAMKSPGNWNNWYNIGSDSRKPFYIYFGGYNSWNDDKLSRYYNFWLSASLRPNNALLISLNPNYDINKDNMQYITTTSYNNNDRYLFGRIDQKTLGITARLNYSLTPNLSIQYYGQPFVSAGKYTDIKRITRPKASKYEDRFHTFTNSEISYDDNNQVYDIDENRDGIFDYSVDNPDFNFREFRSNLVIRWEYRAGSTIYLVWSQGRTGFESIGDFSFKNDTKKLFEVYPDNVFLIKVNYWFSL